MRRLGALALSVLLAACGSSTRFELSNQSETWLSATLWTLGPEGDGSFRPGRPLVVGPGGTIRSSDPAIVDGAPLRVQLEALGPSFRSPAAIWFELTPPAPMRLAARGAGAELSFDRPDAGGIRALSALAARLMPTPDGGPEEPEPWMPTLGPGIPSETTGPVRQDTLPKSEQGG